MRDVVARIDSLGELINDVMVFARPRPPHPSEFDLRPLVDEATIMLRRDPVGAPLEVIVNGPDVTLTADRELIRGAILNLLLNSAQALGGTGRITVTIAQRDEQCVLDIVDNGPGVPAEVRDTIFEPFFTTKARGGGLGLPIARRTAELHGGTLVLMNVDGRGAGFRMTLPKRALELKEAV
jgi:signal transduction histidine kinase